MNKFTKLFSRGNSTAVSVPGSSAPFSASSATATLTNRTSYSPFNALSMKNRTVLRRVLLVVVLVGLLIAIIRIINVRMPNNGGVLSDASSSAQGSATIARSYQFNARNEQGRIVDKKPLKVTVASAERNSRILIKGQPATARDGKIFLIVNVDIENPYPERYFMPVNDLVRWQDQEGKLRAPDVHNNLVLADAISTKSTRIGFLVDATIRKFTVQVGEVNSEKQTIELEL